MTTIINGSSPSITFSDGTTQSTAAITNTDFNTIGSYVIAIITTTQVVSIGSTAAGSGLKRANTTTTTLQSGGASAAVVSISASGTWRAMAYINATGFGGDFFATALWVRIS